MNLYQIPQSLHLGEEHTEVIASGEYVRIERIISSGHTTPPGKWYDQERDEWVVLLEGEAVLEYADGGRDRMARGDWVYLPAHRKHRVAETRTDPPCVWLAVHANLGPMRGG